MENLNFNGMFDNPNGNVESTPEDLYSNLNFDEWDENFIASFEENIFNLIDDDGKNVGFMVSPNEKDNPMFLSPDGKRLCPESFRRSLASPPETLKFTPVTGPELHGFPGSQMPDTGFISMFTQGVSTQSKKQLFPSQSETAPSDSLQDQCGRPNGSSTLETEDISNTPLPSTGRLQEARLKLKLTLQKVVEKASEKENEPQRLNGESEVMFKHPELRQALGTNNASAGLNGENRRRQASTKSSARKVSERKPYNKEICKHTSTYSRIQPKPTQLQYFAICPIKK